MLEKQILHAWNAVNVCGSGGVLQRGLVVDKTDSGFLIDFGIPGQQPELFPFGSVFSHSATLANVVRDGDIFFLYQLSPQHAWTWYPAKVLAVYDTMFVLAEFTWENVRVRDMFHWRRFQTFFPYPYSGPYPIQFEGETPRFEKTDIVLPDGFTEKERFLEMWKKVPHVYPVGIEGNRFSYIYDAQHHYKMKGSYLCVPFVNVAQGMELTTIGQHGLCCTCKTQLTTVPEEMSITNLPLDIMTDVLSFLDCTERTRLRRISADWSDMIESFSSEIVHLDLSNADHWRMALALHKCLTSFTKYVLFVGDANSPQHSSCIVGRAHAGTLVQLASLAAAKLCAIVLTKLPISVDFVHRDGDAIFSQEFQTICGCVILRDVTSPAQCSPLNHRFDWMPGASSQVRGPVIHISYCKYATSDKTALLEAYEENCPELSDMQLGDVAYFIALSDEFVQDEEPHFWLQQALLEVIKKWQRDDPRFGPDCSWMQVEAAQLHEEDNLRTLRKTTLAVLARAVYRFIVDGLIDFSVIE